MYTWRNVTERQEQLVILVFHVKKRMITGHMGVRPLVLRNYILKVGCRLIYFCLSSLKVRGSRTFILAMPFCITYLDMRKL